MLLGKEVHPSRGVVTAVMLFMVVDYSWKVELLKVCVAVEILLKQKSSVLGSKGVHTRRVVVTAAVLVQVL